MMRAEMSIWPRPTPCRAQVGSAWCRLCHDSPNDTIASGQKLVERSLLVHGRSPIMWQIELTDQVTWCSTPTRTSPAQKNAVAAPHHDQLIRPPRTAGATRLTTVHTGNCRLIRAVSRSASRSGANRAGLVRSGRSIQPKWACQKPRATAAGVVPNSQGECGSPSLSVKAWWRRWSATQVMSGPCSAMLPSTASMIRTGRTALNERWVKWRW